jgi:hypothetical protein
MTSTGKNASGESQIVPETAQGGVTASGQALRQLAGEEEVPKAGTHEPKATAEMKAVKPDAAGPTKPTGLQAKPAEFTTNGSLEAGTLPTNYGLVPASALVSTPEEAEKRLEEAAEARKAAMKTSFTAFDRVPEETVNRMRAAELRAVADQRGYDIPYTGTRVTRAAFLRAQEADENLSDAE